MDHYNYLIKCALSKDAQGATLKIGLKALRQAFMGGRRLRAGPGLFRPQRQAAVVGGNRLMNALQQSGVNVHRARVKTPGSMQAKGLTTVPDDLLGMQIYGRNMGDVRNAMAALQRAGVTGLKPSVKVRPGYHGVNIKGTYGQTPIEMQVSPGRASNVGQMMEHALGYKQKTEAPGATWFDKWIGRKVAPWLVRRSWLGQ